MELNRLVNLIDELAPNSSCKYVRSDDTCTFVRIDTTEIRLYTKTPKHEDFTFSKSFIEALASKIKAYKPFSTSQLLNNKGSNRAVIDSIIANTKEFYWIQKNNARFVVWIPDKPHNIGELMEWTDMDYLAKNQSSEAEDIEVSHLIVNDIDDKPYNLDELTNILQNMIDESAPQSVETACSAFGFKYSQVLVNNKINETDIRSILSRLNLRNSLYDNIVDGKNLGISIKKGSYGLRFWSPDTIIAKAKKNIVNRNPPSVISSYLTALRTKPFMLLAGISGTGKSRIVRKLAQATVTEDLQRKYDKNYKGEDFANDRWKLHSPANFQLIQVKPNWHNSMDVVGYLSNIPSPHYVFTPFINFVVKAWLNPDVPFFLCLDEMNLAPVEEYFAEFLSAIESRSFENGEYMTDPIIKPFDEFGNGIGVSMIKELNDALKTPMSTEVEQHLRNKGLTLPKNLLVIGTVNMDETTFSFSRKVLDRAMSIEMNEVDYGSFLSSSTDEDLHAIVSAFEQGMYKKSDGTVATLNELLVERHIEAREVTTELGGAAEGSDAKFVIDYLETINHLLDGTPFKLGYRAANEALIYVRSAQEFGMKDVTSALDSFTMMKILSRIEGDESKLRLTDSAADNKKLEKCDLDANEATKYGELTILTALREIIKNKLGECQPDDRLKQPDAEEESLNTGTDDEQRQSIQKIDQMISQLARDHFVSYWN